MEREFPKCFISYRSSDVDSCYIELFKNELYTASKNRLKILNYKDLMAGKNIESFMKEIYNVDAVIILMTPGYKSRIKKKELGVYNEFTVIYRRYEDLIEGHKIETYEETPNMAIIPILYRGSKDDSLIPQIKDLKFIDFRKFIARKNNKGDYYIPDDIFKIYKNKFIQIAQQIESTFTSNTHYFKIDREKFKHELFLTRKAEHVSFEIQDKIFTKTKAFLEVNKQTGYLLIGRKGSGKSTITRYLTEKKKPLYKGCINLKADDFNMETIFSYFNNEQIQADTKDTLSRLKTFKFAWELFIYLRCIQIIVIEYDMGRLSVEQMRYIRPLQDIIDKITINTRDVGFDKRDEQFFIYSLSKVHKFIDHCINSASCDLDSFLSDVVGKFQFSELLDWALGCDVISAFFKIIKDCKRRILITLDNFDEMYDEYRKRTTYYYRNEKSIERTEFESLWLRSLLSIVINIKQSPDPGIPEPFFSLLDFCIAIPKDRFMEIQEVERDSYIYEGKYMQMNWTGIELSIVIRKRLELLGRFSTTKEKTPIERLNEAMDLTNPRLPETINLQSGEANVKMPLFLYVLRFTFWRPRAILMYYASLFALAENLEKKKLEISDVAIKRNVSQVSYSVVTKEFINEFQNVFFNINNVLGKFSNSKQNISYEELNNKLGHIEFEFSFQSEPVKEFRKKILFLYEIGFLGFCVSQEIMERYNLMMKHVFYFNEGDALIRGINDLNFEDTSFIIHPMFRDYLRLKLNGTELLLNYTWDYINENEAFFHSIL